MSEVIKNEEPKAAMPLWARIVLVLVSYYLLSGIFQVVGILFSDYSISDLTDLKNMEPTLFLSLQVFGFLALVPVIYIFRKFIDRRSIASLGLGFKNRTRDVIIGFLFALSIIVGGSMILFAFEYINILEFQFDGKALLLTFVLFLFVSLNEEILVRGYILNNLLTKMNKFVALLISSVIFALMHGFNSDISFIPMFNLLLAGFLLGAAYIYTKNLWFSISLHLFWNFLQGPIMGYSVSGQKVDSMFTIEILGTNSMNGGGFGFEGSIVCSILCALTIGIVFWYYKRKEKLELANENES